MFGAVSGDDIDGQVSGLIRSFLPSIDELSDLLRDRFDLNVSADNEIEIDLYEALGVNFNLSTIDLPVPPLIDGGLSTLEILLPFINRTQLEEANITIPDLGPLGEDVSLIDLIDGNLEVNLGQILETLSGNDLTTLAIPFEPLLDQLINSTAGLEVSLLLAQNFTVSESFEAPEGKFPTNLGDVVLIDCNYAKNLIFSSYNRIFNRIVTNQPFFYAFVQALDSQIKA